MRTFRLLRFIALVAALTLVLTACAQEDDTENAVDGSGASDVDEAEEAETEEEAGEGQADADGAEEGAETSAFQDGDVLRIILGSAPGGGFDTQARLLVPYLETAFRDVAQADVTVRVENMPGAAHRVATEFVNRAEPAGRTILFGASNLSAQNQVFEESEFDLRTMTAIAGAGLSPLGFAVRRDAELPELTFNGLIERSQQEPVVTTHPAIEADMTLLELLLAEEGVELNLQLVPVASTSDQMAALLRGDSDAVYTTLAGIAPFVDDNPDDLAFIASMGCEDWRSDAESIVTQGVPNAEEICSSSVGGNYRIFVGPPGMPDEIASVLEEVMLAALADEEYMERAQTAGFEIERQNAAELREALDGRVETYLRYAEEIEA